MANFIDRYERLEKISSGTNIRKNFPLLKEIKKSLYVSAD